MSIQPVKPNALKKGDTVAIVAPSGIVSKKSLERGIRFLESLDLRVKIGSSVMQRWGYLAGTDHERARDFMAMWADSDVKAVIAARGGYGAMRILPHLDFDCIRENPKILLGYSDITALHLALWKEAGLVTFHGPVAEIWAREMNPYDGKLLKELLFGLWPPGILAMPAIEQNAGETAVSHCSSSGSQKAQTYAPDIRRLLALESGSAQGQLTGGNLSLIASTIGTPWEIDTKGKILFIEEVGEKPYRVDRMLCQLELAGKLRDAAGFCIGDFTDCEAEPNSQRPTFTVAEVLEQYFAGTGKPCIVNVPAGHGKFNAVLPLGVEVIVEGFSDGATPSICFPEKALN